MADETSTSSVIVDIDTTSASQQLATLNASIRTLNGLQRELKKEIAAGNDEFGRNSQLVAENDKALKLLQAQAKSLTGQIQNETTANEGLGDSFVELDAYCRQLERQYKSLTAAQRESAEGQELKKQLVETKQSLKDFDAELGNHQRNVGNYPDAVRPLLSGLENLANRALPGVTKGMNLTEFSVKGLTKAMLANPIGLVVAALMALWNALQKNDAAMTAVQRLFASFSPILDIFKAGLNTVVGVIGKLADGLSDILSKIGLVKEKQDLVTSMDAIEERERKYTVNSAKRSKQISEARAKAADKETYSTEERMKALEDAMQLEKENLKEAQDIARERLRIMVQQARRNQDTSDETANKIAEARAAMYRAEEEYNNGVRKLTRELNSARQEEANAVKAAEKEKADAANAAAKEGEKAAKDAAEKQKKAEGEAARGAKENAAKAKAAWEAYYEHKKKLASDAQDVQRQLEDHLLAQTEEGADKDIALMELQTAREVEEIENRYRELAEASAEGQDMVDQLIMQKWSDFDQKAKERREKQKEADDASVKATAKTVQQEALNTSVSVSTLLSATADMIQAFDDKSEESAAAQKALALGVIAINTGKALAAGIAGATEAAASTGPAAPFTLIAYIAEMTAVIAANIASAVKVVKGAKFATGGIVPGTSYTGDLVSARLNSGEMVLNKQQQTRLFEIANTGTTSSVAVMTEAFATAVSQLPAPVLQYTEFEQFTDDVRAVRMAAEY